MKLHIREQQPRPPHHRPTHECAKQQPRRPHRSSLARCSQPLSTNQTPHPTTKAGQQQIHRTAVRAPPQGGHGLVVSKPNSVSGSHRRPTRPNGKVCRAPEPAPLQRTAHPTNRSAHRTPTHCGRGMSLVVLLRKEVIQPHLPVRLPCYDFVPIADPTFDGSLPYGLGHRLRVLPTFMT